MILIVGTTATTVRISVWLLNLTFRTAPGRQHDKANLYLKIQYIYIYIYILWFVEFFIFYYVSMICLHIAIMFLE